MVSISRQLLKLSVTLQILVSDCVSFCAAGLRSRTALAAENVFLRKQLALFQEREKKAAATAAADRFVLSKLALCVAKMLNADGRKGPSYVQAATVQL